MLIILTHLISSLVTSAAFAAALIWNVTLSAADCVFYLTIAVIALALDYALCRRIRKKHQCTPFVHLIGLCIPFGLLVFFLYQVTAGNLLLEQNPGTAAAFAVFALVGFERFLLRRQK